MIGPVDTVALSVATGLLSYFLILSLVGVFSVLLVSSIIGIWCLSRLEKTFIAPWGRAIAQNDQEACAMYLEAARKVWDPEDFRPSLTNHMMPWRMVRRLRTIQTFISENGGTNA